MTPGAAFELEARTGGHREVFFQFQAKQWMGEKSATNFVFSVPGSSKSALAFKDRFHEHIRLAGRGPFHLYKISVAQRAPTSVPTGAT